jgi:hypothetical protein
MRFEEVQSLVRKDLMETYNENLEDPYSPEILDALEVVIQYYTKPSEYAEWYRHRRRDDLK